MGVISFLNPGNESIFQGLKYLKEIVHLFVFKLTAENIED
jgi:hypothetical protein